MLSAFNFVRSKKLYVCLCIKSSRHSQMVSSGVLYLFPFSIKWGQCVYFDWQRQDCYFTQTTKCVVIYNDSPEKSCHKVGSLFRGNESYKFCETITCMAASRHNRLPLCRTHSPLKIRFKFVILYFKIFSMNIMSTTLAPYSNSMQIWTALKGTRKGLPWWGNMIFRNILFFTCSNTLSS